MAEQSQDPAHPDPDPGEAGLGPGEQGESIEDARKGDQGEGRQGDAERESGDSGER